MEMQMERAERRMAFEFGVAWESQCNIEYDLGISVISLLKYWATLM